MSAQGVHYMEEGADASTVHCGGLRALRLPALLPGLSLERTSVGGRNYTDEQMSILSLIEAEVLSNATVTDRGAFDLPRQTRTLAITNIFKFHLLMGIERMLALAIEKGIDYHVGCHSNFFDGKIDSRIVAAMVSDIDNAVITQTRKYSKVLLALTAEGCIDPDCAWTYATFTSENIDRLQALALSGHDVMNCKNGCSLAQASTSSWAARDVIRNPLIGNEVSKLWQKNEGFRHKQRRGRPAASAAHQPSSSTTKAEVRSTIPAEQILIQCHEHFSDPFIDSSDTVDRIELGQAGTSSTAAVQSTIPVRNGSARGVHDEWLLFSDILDLEGNILGSNTEVEHTQVATSSPIASMHTDFPFPASPARTVPRTVPPISPSTSVVTRGSKKGAVPSSPSSFQKYPASTWAFTEVKRRKPKQSAPYHTYTQQQEPIPADNMAHHNGATSYMDMETGDSYPQYLPDPYGTSTWASTNIVERWRPEQPASSHTHTQQQEYGSGQKIKLSDGAGRGKRRPASDVGGSSTQIREPDVHLLKLKTHKRSATDESSNQTSNNMLVGRDGDQIDNRNEGMPAQHYSVPLVYSTISRDGDQNELYDRNDMPVESPSTVKRRKWSDYMPAHGEL